MKIVLRTGAALEGLVVDRAGRRLIVGGDDGVVTVFEGSLLSKTVLLELGRHDLEWLQSRLLDPAETSRSRASPRSPWGPSKSS